MGRLLCFVIFTVVLFTIINDCQGDCCNSQSNSRFSRLALCGDLTLPTPCCGNQSCNFFCCNCGGGCRKSRDKREANSGRVSLNGFQAMDQNKDGFFDKKEAHDYLLSGACGNYTEKILGFHSNFNFLDKDGDGKLNYVELNPDGAQIKSDFVSVVVE